MENKNEFVEVYSGTLWQSTAIKDLLEDNGNQTFIENQLMGIIDPSLIRSEGVAPAMIKIKQTDFTYAKMLIDKFNNAYFSLEEEFE